MLMGKNSAVIGVVVIVLLVVGGIGFAFRHEIKGLLTGSSTSAPAEQTTTPTSTAPQTANPSVTESVVEVNYDGSAFSPSPVTIKVGTTVKFVNKSSEGMDVASNPHPTHTDYPGFDQGKSSSAGQNEYDFTFEKVGTWGYHNHLDPAQGGQVVVTE